VNRILPYAALVGLALALYFQGLGQLPFYTIGEPREALEIWEEIHNGEWVLPSRNGIDLPSKPPLFHWLGGLAALATGNVDEFAARLPSALLATLSLLLVYWFGARKWGKAAGLVAACVLATNFEWIRAARSARVDIVLTAFITGALLAFDAVATANPPRRLMLLLFYLCMGLATLAKGPIGFLLPGLVAFAYLLLRRDLRRLRDMHLFLGGALTLLLPGCWYALAIMRGGQAFVHKQILTENLMTFFGWASDPGTPSHSLLYVVPAFFGGFAPWSLFVVPLAVHLYQRRRQLAYDGDLYPLVWFVAIFLFFMIAAGKRTVYLLPVYPAAALLLGAWWSRISSGEWVLPRAVVAGLRAAAVVGTMAILVFAWAVAAEGSGAHPSDLFRPYLHHTDQENLPLVHEIIQAQHLAFLAWAAMAAALALVFLAAVWRRRWSWVCTSIATFATSTTLLMNVTFHPELARRRTFKPFLETVRTVVGNGDQLAFYKTFDYGAVFYWQRRIPVAGQSLVELNRTGQFRYLLMWESEWKKLAADESGQLELVRRSEGTGPDGSNPLVLARFIEQR
jgi:4-amino-4-deoxy-L-arabinose transferase-like glycosyltransferase